MKKIFLTIFFLLLGSTAEAQSTATPVQLGFLTTTGCPSGAFSCWKSYSSTNPLPVSLTITP